MDRTTALVATSEARAREAAEPVKRRVRGHGQDILSAGRRARARESPPDAEIDAVITWVDDRDPTWHEQHDRVFGASQAPDSPRAADVTARFRSLGELRYALRGIDRNMPWVREVVLVTSGQPPPDWLDTRALRVVTHREFMQRSALPNFNSHAIEAAIWRIDGLAEHFVYFNDDVLVLRPVRPNDLFTPDGRPRVCLTRLPVAPGLPTLDDSAAVNGARNARDLLAGAGLGQATRMVAHTPNPQRRSLHAEIASRFPRELDATERTPVRSCPDLAPVFLHTWYALLTGRAEEVQMTSRYVELCEQGGLRDLNVQVRRRDIDYLCPNLAADPVIDWPELAEGVQRSLERALPGPSRFEKA